MSALDLRRQPPHARSGKGRVALGRVDGQSSRDTFDAGSRWLVFGDDARQPSPIQASNQAWAGDGCRQAERRSGTGDIKQHPQAGCAEGDSLMRYAVVIEKANDNYSAYVPDLPGCIATGDSIEEVEAEIGEAIRLHVEGLLEDGLPVPEPTAIAEYVEA